MMCMKMPWHRGQNTGPGAGRPGSDRPTCVRYWLGYLKPLKSIWPQFTHLKRRCELRFPPNLTQWPLVTCHTYTECPELLGQPGCRGQKGSPCAFGPETVLGTLAWTLPVSPGERLHFRQVANDKVMAPLCSLGSVFLQL